MEKLIITVWVFVFLQIIPPKSYSQDFLNINFSGEQDAQVNPTRVINSDGKSYLLYDKENSSNPSNPYVGITKIDYSTNQILFDIRFDLSSNTDYGLSHIIKGIDIEAYGNSLYVLASINNRDILLIQLDKNTGVLIKKNIIPVSNNNYFQNFTPIDLFFGKSWIDSDPYIAILGKTNSGNIYNNKLQLIYKKISETIFNTVTFNYQYPTGFNNPKINWFSGNELQISFSDFSDIKVLVYNIITQQIEQNYLHYIDGDHKIEGLTYFNWDGIGFYMGQLTYNGVGDYSGDVFYFRTDDFVSYQKPISTFNNPNFKLVKGDSHPNEEDYSLLGYPYAGYLYVNAGLVSTSAVSFAGLYYEPGYPTHPRYGVGRFDLTNGESGSDLFKAYSYTLRDMGGSSFSDPNNVANVYPVFGSSVFSTLANNTTSGIFYRKPTGLTDKSNAYYLPQMAGPSNCSNTIDFTRTHLGTSALRVNKQYGLDLIDVFSQTISASDLSINQSNYNPGQISSVCSEQLTNSILPPPVDGGGYWDPICGCYVLLSPVNNQMSNHTGTVTHEKENRVGFSVFPNPINNNNMITCRATSIIRNVVVENANGRSIAVKNNVFSKQAIIKLPQINSGIYFVKMTTIDGKQKTEKVIKL